MAETKKFQSTSIAKDLLSIKDVINPLVPHELNHPISESLDSTEVQAHWAASEEKNKQAIPAYKEDIRGKKRKT